jgi:kynurenine 3-monooxygenase
MASDGRSVIVLGAGLAGTLMAVLLGKAGYRVRVFERRSDPRSAGATGGRSINLALSTRGLDALERAGVLDRIMKIAVPMRGRMIHGTDGEVKFQAYGPRPEHAINSVSRGELNRQLIEAADALENVELVFDRRCTGVDLDAPSVTLEDPTTGAVSLVEADAVVAADGAFSAARDAMQRSGRFDFQQSYLAHGYKEMTLPAVADGSWAMEPNALHIWPRGQFMMIALPNRDGSFTCTLFWPFEGEHSFEATRTREQLQHFFRATFPDAVPLMPDFVDEYFENPTGSLVTIRCHPWQHRGKVVLLGDSAHAVVPFYGQGANAAFEDCVILADLLSEHGGSFAEALPAFEKRRKEHADALADLALANYIEMRDHTASAAFRLRKSLEHRLHALMPSVYLPLYTMVTFSRIPYADAVRRARRQSRIIRWAGAGVVLALAAFAWGGWALLN